MSNIFNDYIVGAEREAAIEEMHIENVFSKLNTMYEMVNLKYDQMLKDAEYKIFSESGTYDDYAYFVEEATAEANADKRGLLEKIAAGISELFRKIIDGIKGFFGKGKPEDVSEVDQGDWDAITMLNNNVSKLQSALDKFKSGDITGGLAELPAVIKIAGILGGTVATGKLIKVPRKDAEGKVSIINLVIEKLQDALEGVKKHIPNGVADTVKKAMDEIKKMLSHITAPLNNIKKAFSKENPAGNAQTPEERAIENNKKAAENGILQIQMGKNLWKIDKNTGKIFRTDGLKVNDMGKEVPDDQAPNEVIRKAKQIRGQIAMQKQASNGNGNAKPEKVSSQLRNLGIMGADAHAHSDFAPMLRISPKNGKVYYYKDGSNEAPIEVTDANYKQFMSKPGSNKKPRESIMANEWKQIKDHAASIFAQNNGQPQVETNSASFAEFVDQFREEFGIEIVIEDVNDPTEELEAIGYTVEETDDFVLIYDAAALGNDNYVESTLVSIFGVEEELTESVDFDAELEALAQLFED